jgi:predicted GIY-YIG superfamily endonuclease
MYVLYILLCSNNSLYTGITSNLEQRLSNHRRKNFSRYVSSHLPFKLVYSTEFPTRISAAKRERQIKGWKREKKVAILALDV